MLNVYSRARDGETLLSRSFRAKEFACKDGTDPLFVDSELVQVLQAIRDHFGAPVVITSGYRTAAHNRAVGGAVYSQHQYGRAADIRVSGVPVEQLAAYAETLLPGTGGIGTTIFYVLGSVLVIGAAVLLVTKKRMSTKG